MGGRKVMDFAGVLYYLAASCAFVAGAAVTTLLTRDPERRRRNRNSSRTSRIPLPPLRHIRYAAIGAWLLAMVGYLAWFAIGIHRAGDLDTFLTRIFSAIGVVPLYQVSHGLLEPVAGITTLVHLSVPAVAFAGLWWVVSRSGKVRLWPLIVVGSLTGGALLRAVFMAERLALMEIAIPLLIIFLFARRKRGAFISLALPALMILVVYGLFTLTEAFRSWVVLGSRDDSIWAFGFFRLVGYYAQALNNTVYLVGQDLALETPFYFSLRWFWDYPLLSDQLWTYSSLSGTDPAAVTSQVMNASALNRDFATFSMPGYLFLDFGWGALVIIAALGSAIQALYDRVAAGSWRALILYASVFVGVLEFPRIFYWPDGRVFVIVGYIGVVLGILALTRSTRRSRPAPARSGAAT